MVCRVYSLLSSFCQCQFNLTVAKTTRKTAATAENPACPKKPFCDIQIKVVILLLANIWMPYRSPITQTLSDLGFHLSRSLKVKCNTAIGLPIYGFLLMFNSDIGPN